MHHALLVERLIKRNLAAAFLKALSDAGQVAVAEDAASAADGALAMAVPLRPLRGQEPGDCLPNRKPHASTHGVFSPAFCITFIDTERFRPVSI